MVSRRGFLSGALKAAAPLGMATLALGPLGVAMSGVAPPSVPTAKPHGTIIVDASKDNSDWARSDECLRWLRDHRLEAACTYRLEIDCDAMQACVFQYGIDANRRVKAGPSGELTHLAFMVPVKWLPPLPAV